MHRTLSPALLFALAFALGPVLSQPAQAQVGARAYAPENLGSLNTADQTRVIAQEYREQSSGLAIPNDQLRFYLDQVRLSRWTFSQVRQDIAKSLGSSDGGWRPPGKPGGQVVRCESSDGRARNCATPWSGHSMLSKQLSKAHCTRGQTWFSTAGRVTVTQGCRAEFQAAAPLPGNHQATLQCESSDGRLRTCGSNVVGRAQLQRQLSKTRCVENSNFGVRNRSLWVDGGCRGVFLVRTPGNGNPHPGDYSVTCSSDNNRYETCVWDARRGAPRLIQQLSTNACRSGHSWGYSARSGLWVNHGCRGRFGTR
ncbi:MAG: DUF3011 domain-containing protein [Lysobacteraceae bacterium]|nr:MAG: DUF3011 domain-containing protein [Xanthomonadaceae bacterium]